MKKILILFTILILCGCSANNKPNNVTNACGVGTCESDTRGENWSTKDVINGQTMVVTMNESVAMLTQTAVMFYSFEDCPWCYDALPVLQDVAKDYGVNTFYVDMKRDERSDENAVYQIIKDKFKEQCGEEMYVPFAVALVNGEVVACNIGTVESHTKVDGDLPSISEKQKTELKQIYTNMYESIKKASD